MEVAMEKLPFALQLYTVRDHLDKDVAGTLAKVKEMGYGNVEAGGTHGLSEAEFKKLLDASGLKPISTHVGYDDVVHRPSKVIETAGIYGVGYVVIGGIDPRLTPDKEGWVACGKALDAAGATLRAAGISLCYHNHSHEFNRIGDEYPLDLLLGAAQPDRLMSQLDTFWVRYAGLNPVMFIKKYSGRCPLLHVKDMTDLKSKAFAEVGAGILNWPEIFEAALAAGTQWFIVEQDSCAKDSLVSARISAEFMKKQRSG
jgi:sugar phosphate isomerase/epimerase